MKSIITLVLLSFSLSLMAQPTHTEKEIQYLINYLKGSDCSFVRNGSSYSGAKASEHLAGKYDYAKDKITSAESFIENIASQSYFSGKAYQVNCPDHASVASKQWLTERLTEYRNNQANN